MIVPTVTHKSDVIPNSQKLLYFFLPYKTPCVPCVPVGNQYFLLLLCVCVINVCICFFQTQTLALSQTVVPVVAAKVRAPALHPLARKAASPGHIPIALRSNHQLTHILPKIVKFYSTRQTKGKTYYVHMQYVCR